MAENLLIRHWECDWICPLCRGAFEDTDHLFRQCDFTQQTWNLVTSARGITINQNHSNIAEWMASIASLGSRLEVKEKIGTLLKMRWHVWLQRNRKIFQVEKPNVPQTAHLIFEELQECEFAFQPP